MDDLAVVCRAVLDDQRGRRGGRAPRKFLAAAGAPRPDDGVRPVRALSHAAAARRSRGRGKSRVVGAHVPHDVRCPDRIRGRVFVVGPSRMGYRTHHISKECSMIRKTMRILLVALVAAFALSSTAEAAPKKATRARAKHSSRVTSGSQTKSHVARKKTAKRKTVGGAGPKKNAAKRAPTTKPRYTHPPPQQSH